MIERLGINKIIATIIIITTDIINRDILKVADTPKIVGATATEDQEALMAAGVTMVTDAIITIIKITGLIQDVLTIILEENHGLKNLKDIKHY